MKIMRRCFTISLLVFVLPACGSKKKTKEIIHAPDELLIKRPMSLAGQNPEERDLETFRLCLIGKKDEAECNLPYLLFAEDEAISPIEKIMNATLISDSWQRDRWLETLQRMRPELIRMFQCVKGVSISGDIRPSFYFSSTSGIYLDATSLAQTEAEKATLDPKKDARSANFTVLPYIFTSASLAKEMPEDFRIYQRIESLLIHELTHACDFKQRSQLGRLISDDLPDAPQNEAYHLAQWLYFANKSAKEKIEKSSALAIGESYSEGDVIDLYGYTNRREHLAMIVETQLDYEFHATVKHDFIVNQAPEGQSLRDQTLLWGTTNKFCEPNLLRRSRDFSERVLGSPLAQPRDSELCLEKSIEAGITLNTLLNQ